MALLLVAAHKRARSRQMHPWHAPLPHHATPGAGRAAPHQTGPFSLHRLRGGCTEGPPYRRKVMRSMKPQAPKCAIRTRSEAAGCTPLTHTDRTVRLQWGAGGRCSERRGGGRHVQSAVSAVLRAGVMAPTGPAQRQPAPLRPAPPFPRPAPSTHSSLEAAVSSWRRCASASARSACSARSFTSSTSIWRSRCRSTCGSVGGRTELLSGLADALPAPNRARALSAECPQKRNRSCPPPFLNLPIFTP